MWLQLKWRALVKKFNIVSKPKHYTNSKYEAIDIIQDKMTQEEYRGYLRGNVLKYLLRFPHKNGGAEDLQKGLWYLERLISWVKI